MPRPWIRRTSAKPASWAASRYDSTTDGMSRGAKGCRSSASSIGTMTGSSSSSTRGDLVEELHHRVGERVVLVARHHVPRPRDVDPARVRHQVQEGARVLLAHDVALPAAHEERWHTDGACRVLEAFRVANR